MKSSEFLALLNLSDFRIGMGYWLELKHGLMGTFPALTTKDDEPFFCLNEDAVRKALSLLSKRSFRINKTLLLINEKKKTAFDLLVVVRRWDRGEESESAPIFTEDDLGGMKVGDLKWAPGLVGDTMTCEEFEETLRFAMARIKE